MALVCMAALGGHARAASVDRITVDAHAVTRTLPATFFGVNYVGFWDQNQGSVASAAALAQTPIKLVRFPGGAPGDWYDWADPYYKGWSSTGPLDLWRYSRRFGGTALFQTNYQGHLPNPPGKPYAVNSPQNAAAWVRYDKAHGIHAIMEVGNEEDIKIQHSDDAAWQQYSKAFNAQARAMHEADRHVTVIGPAGTNEWQWWGVDSLGAFLRLAGNRTGTGQVDGVSLHFYQGSTWDDSKSVPQYWLSAQGPWNDIAKTIRLHDTRHLPVYITEWNIGANHNNNTFNNTLGHALVTADMIGAFAQSGVMGEDYFDLHAGDSWGLLYAAGESRPLDTPTPSYYAMALWSQMGTRLLRSSVSADPASTVSSYATARPDGSLQVLAINKSGQPQAVQVAVSHQNLRGRTLRVYDLAGRGGWDVRDVFYDGASNPRATRPLPGPHTTQRLIAQTVAYTLPPYAATVLAISAR